MRTPTAVMAVVGETAAEVMVEVVAVMEVVMADRGELEVMVVVAQVRMAVVVVVEEVTAVAWVLPAAVMPEVDVAAMRAPILEATPAEVAMRHRLLS